MFCIIKEKSNALNRLFTDISKPTMSGRFTTITEQRVKLHPSNALKTQIARSLISQSLKFKAKERSSIELSKF